MEIDHKTFLVEVDDASTGRNRGTGERGWSDAPASALENPVRRVDLDAVRNLIADVQKEIVASLQAASDPSKVSIEFSIKFAAEGGLPFVSKVSGEGALKITLDWEREGR